MKASSSPFRVKIDGKKAHHPTCPLVPGRGRQIYYSGKMYDALKLLNPASIRAYKDSHQFSCKIQA
jgi:hypothetical protein